MTTFTNPEGLAITHTNEFSETVLLQLSSSNNYYTSGEHDIICIEIGSNKILILYYRLSLSTEMFFKLHNK